MLNRLTLNRVVVYGMPRTGTTVMQAAISHRFDLAYLGEIHETDSLTPGVSVPWTQKHKSWCAKFLTNSVGSRLADHVAACDPQYMVIMRRERLADAVCSMHLARHIGKWHHHRPFRYQKIQPLLIPEQAVIYWINFVYYPYLKDVEQIESWAVEKRWYTQEHIEAGGEIEIANNIFTINKDDTNTVASGIDYTKIIQNYCRVEQMVSEPEKHRMKLLGIA